MNCPACATPLADGARFCGVCGAAVSSTTAAGTVHMFLAESVPMPGPTGSTHLLVLHLPDHTELTVPFTDAPLTIGPTEQADLRVADPSFAHLQLLVTPDHGGYRLRDMTGRHSLLAHGVKVNEANLSQ